MTEKKHRLTLTLYSLVYLLNPIMVIFPAGSPYPIPTPGLHQSCRHVVRSWANQSFGAHLHNMTLTNGKLRVPQDGRYYLYSQVIPMYYSGLYKVDLVRGMNDQVRLFSREMIIFSTFLSQAGL